MDQNNKEEYGKISSEINQVVNQRFIISTFTITIFGVFSAWVISKDFEGKQELILLSSVIIMLILVALFYYSLSLKRYIRTLTSYMVVNFNSDWERQWYLFRQTNKTKAYSNIQSIIFLLLGTINILITLTIIPLTDFNSSIISVLFLSISIIYIGFILLIGFRDKKRFEKELIIKWKETLQLDKKKYNKNFELIF
jgi:hypothetical protein